MSDPFHYELPPELLAHRAAEPRDSARLLVFPGLGERIFKELPELLRAGDVLVLNTSKVIPARLFAVRPARDAQGKDVPVELLLHRVRGEGGCLWEVMARPTRRLAVGDRLVIDDYEVASVVSVGERPVIRFEMPADEVPGLLERHGQTPLPPYIHAEDSAATRARYQTVYADAAQAGSVAAPTAGLHFTPAVLEALAAKGVRVVDATLHVGAGTFLNPTPEQIAAKQLHAEHAVLPAETAQAVLAAKVAGGRVVAVGTTALRTLESWARYADMAAEGWEGETTLFIQPGDDFRVVDGLLTNFHLSGSSLLMLVGAFIGVESMRTVYAHAIAERFRFYSFGDTSLLWRAKDGA